MYSDLFTESYIAKLETARIERQAARNFRFRHLRSPESKFLLGVLASVLGLFIR